MEAEIYRSAQEIQAANRRLELANVELSRLATQCRTTCAHRCGGSTGSAR